jgi:hypothetical protein
LHNGELVTYHPARLLRALSILAAYGVLAACGGGEGLLAGGSGSGGGGGGGGNQSFPIGGTVTGLGAGTLVLGNGGDQLTVSTDGDFQFRTVFSTGSPYTVIVRSQPSFPAKDCTVTNGSGTMGSAAVTNVAIACTPLDIPEVRVTPAAQSAQVTWSAIAKAASYNIHASTRQGCDIRNATNCPDRISVMGATSPALVTGLLSGQIYFFQVETVYTNGARGVAVETSARPNALAFHSVDHAVTPDTPLVEGSVFVMMPDEAGGWFLGGAFDAIGGVPRRNLAHLLADGSVDANWNPAVNAAVNRLDLSGDTLYVGGEFTKASGLDALGLGWIAFDAVTGERTP